MRIRALTLATALAAVVFLGGCAAPAAEPVEHVVQVRGMEFEPTELTIAPGDTVRWVFDDEGRPHDVVAYDRSFQSGLLEVGEYSYTFTEEGTFDYFCTPHPGMEGIVIVEAP